MDTSAATIIAGPGESGFRAAITAAQDGDTVKLTNALQLQSTVAINKRITITVDPVEAWRISIEARFEGAMLNLSTNGIVLDGLKMHGPRRGCRTAATRSANDLPANGELPRSASTEAWHLRA